MRRFIRMINRARRRLAWALYQNDEIDKLSHAYQELMRLFTAARRRNEELRDQRDGYKAEADHYRQLTDDLDARLKDILAIRSDFRQMVEKFDSI